MSRKSCAWRVIWSRWVGWKVIKCARMPRGKMYNSENRSNVDEKLNDATAETLRATHFCILRRKINIHTFCRCISGVEYYMFGWPISKSKSYVIYIWVICSANCGLRKQLSMDGNIANNAQKNVFFLCIMIQTNIEIPTSSYILFHL